MWMTRKRSHEFMYSLLSFVFNADDNQNIEYLIVVDPDDDETLTALEKITPMIRTHGVELICIVADKRYGYGELEQYQNLAAKHFTGECLLCICDDNTCIGRGWDTELRNCVSERQGEPAAITIQPLNEVWKGNFTIVGINRAWYEKTNNFSGNRATDAYIYDLAKAAGIKPIIPNIKTLHLQRGREGFMGKISEKGVEYNVFGLPNDETAGGYSSDKFVPPKYYHNPSILQDWELKVVDVIEGKRRFDEDLRKLTDGR